MNKEDNTASMSAEYNQTDLTKTGYSAILDQMHVPRKRLSAKSKPVDLAHWPKDNVVYGGTVKRVTGEKAGLPLERLAGTELLSLSAAKQMDVRKQQTGLFLVDINFVPRELPDALVSRGLTLHSDGTLLDRNLDPVVAFVTSEIYLVQLSQPVAPAPGILASPFPFTCHSFTPWALYHDGFHRWYEAHTLATAFGPDGNGECSHESPHTQIDFIQARAAVREGGNERQCFNCDQVQADDEWDVGIFWPAHGIPVTTHSAIWADGSFSFSRTASFTW
ncbi:MAG: hypothetical protein ACKV2V_27330 [Blastocatellia bacterium]